MHNLDNSVFYFENELLLKNLDTFLHVIDGLAICYNAFLQFLDINSANSFIFIHVLKNNTQECDEWQNVGHGTFTNLGHNIK